MFKLHNLLRLSVFVKLKLDRLSRPYVRLPAAIPFFTLDLTPGAFAYYEMISSRRQSIIVILFTIILVVLVNIAWWVTYARTETRFEYQLSRRLATTARMGASDFTPDLVSALIDGRLIAYDSTLTLIEQMRQMDPLSEVFVIGPDLRYLATTLTTSDSVYYLATLNGPYLDSAFALYESGPGFMTGVVVTEGYSVGEVYLKSAFVPLTDTTGVVGAVLGIEADIDYTDVLGDLRGKLYLSSAFSIGGGILFGFFFFVVQRRLGRAELAVLRAHAQANLGRMVAVVSHEIKNPLMIMRASAEQLQKEYRAPEAEFLLEEVDRLNAIVSGYLGIAGGKKALNREMLETESFIKRIVDQYQARLANDGITLKWHSSEKKRIIHADPVALRQVIINIILNAVEAVKGKDKAQIAITCRNEHGKAIITIEDNGSGIDNNKMQHIFDPFYTTRSTGSGLGLYHSKRLLEQMDGRITIASRPGGPTVVSLEFAVHKQDG